MCRLIMMVMDEMAIPANGGKMRNRNANKSAAGIGREGSLSVGESRSG